MEVLLVSVLLELRFSNTCCRFLLAHSFGSRYIEEVVCCISHFRPL